jgi:outer membrane receptor protein involved in Fe transport
MHAEIESFTNTEVDTSAVTYKNVRPLLTPQIIFNQSVVYSLGSGLTLGLSAQYIGESYLALDNQPKDILPSAFVIDGFLTFEYKKTQLKLQVNNVLDEIYYSSGSMVDIDYDGLNDNQGYFVNASRNFFLSLQLNF